MNRLRMVLATGLLAMGVLAMVQAATPSASAQTTGFISSPTYSSQGVAFVVFAGGGLAELQAAATDSGAGGVWVQDADGAFLLLTIGGPAFLNGRFEGRFAAGFAGPTPVVLTRATAPATPTPTPPTPPSTTPAVGSWTAAEAPPGARASADEWIAIAAPDGRTILASVSRPTGDGPFPALVILHGQSGFSDTYVGLGQEFASRGFVTVVGCWFAGNYDGSAGHEDPPAVTLADGLACPDGPPLQPITSTAPIADVAAILTATRSLSGVDATRVGLMGNSRGAIVGLLSAAVPSARADAVVAIGGAPPGGPLLATQITSPVLLIQGAADSVVPVANAQSLETALRFLGRTVESHYYPNHGHGILFDTPQHTDAVSRTATFLGAQLGD